MVNNSKHLSMWEKVQAVFALHVESSIDAAAAGCNLHIEMYLFA